MPTDGQFVCAKPTYWPSSSEVGCLTPVECARDGHCKAVMPSCVFALECDWPDCGHGTRDCARMRINRRSPIEVMRQALRLMDV